MKESNLPPGVSESDPHINPEFEDQYMFNDELRPTPMPTFSYIRAWGQWRAFDSTDIELEVGLAIDNGAPEKALYYSLHQGHYITVNDPVITEMLRICLTNIARKIDGNQD